jgi:hypothetical protein
MHRSTNTLTISRVYRIAIGFPGFNWRCAPGKVIAEVSLTIRYAGENDLGLLPWGAAEMPIAVVIAPSDAE